MMSRFKKSSSTLKTAKGLLWIIFIGLAPTASFGQYLKYSLWYPPQEIQKDVKAWYVGFEAGAGTTQFNYSDYNTRLWPQKVSVQPTLAVYARAMFNSSWGITPSLAYSGFQHTHFCYVPIQLRTNLIRISLPINRCIGGFNEHSWQVFAGPYVGAPLWGTIQSGGQKISTHASNLFPFDCGLVSGISTRLSLNGEDLGLVFKYQFSHGLINSYGLPERKGDILDLGEGPTTVAIGSRFYMMNQLTVALEIRRVNYILSKSKYDYLLNHYSKQSVKRCLKKRNQ